jgi:hypothetical protein
MAMSPNGDLILVERSGSSGATRVELYTAEGHLETAIRGLARGASPVAFLPGDAVVAAVSGPQSSLAVVKAGRSQTLATETSPDDPGPVYLGWLS